MSAEAGVRRGASRARRAHSVGAPRVQVSEMQRARLLSAAVVTIDELGYARASIAHISRRARVSRKTFYDLFASREDCLLAILQDAVDRVGAELESFDPGVLSWRERVGTGLWSILSFLDREPAIARVCVVQSARGSQRVLESREEILAGLARIIDDGRHDSPRAAKIPPLTAEGVVGAVLGILYKRLLQGHVEPLTGLLGELMSMIVLPYLGPAIARKELARPTPTAPAASVRPGVSASGVGEDPLKDLPMRLTYRTARVLQAAAQHPGASNRLIGEQADTFDQGQISKLLGRLQRVGLLENTGAGQAQGEPNAWSLTPLGVKVAQQLHLDNDSEPSCGARRDNRKERAS
jgi:AcrR family transcriptional regulator